MEISTVERVSLFTDMIELNGVDPGCGAQSAQKLCRKNSTAMSLSRNPDTVQPRAKRKNKC